MSDPYWDPIFARLCEDLELLRNIIADTDDQTVLSWVKPNPPLFRYLMPMTHRNRISARPRFLDVFMKTVAEDPALRRVIFFSWIEANPGTMAFPTLPVDKDSLEKLKKGIFGAPRKILILSRIDPRESPKEVYQAFRSWFSAFQASPSGSDESGPESPNREDSPSKNVPSADLTKSGHASQPPAEALSGKSPEQEHLLAENRRLRRNMKELESHNLKLEAQLSSKSADLVKQRDTVQILEKDLKTSMAKLERVTKDLAIQTNAAATAISAVKAAEAPGSQGGVASKSLEQERRIKDLEEILSRRDATIGRLESELRELRAVAGQQQNHEQGLSRLQKQHQHAEAESEALRRMKIGRLLVHRRSGKKEDRLSIFEPIDGPPEVLAPSINGLPEVIEGEWAALIPPFADHPAVMMSLEFTARREYLGNLHHRDGTWWLDANEGTFPLHLSELFADEGAVYSGTWLPAFGERPAGIYFCRRISSHPGGDAPVTFAGTETIKKFFNLKRIHLDSFVQFIQNRGISFQKKDNGLEFSRDIQEVLSGLRPHLPIQVICDQCLTKVSSDIFARAPSRDEICSQCLNEEEFPSQAFEDLNFRQARILIAGGDVVGARYLQALKPLNLQAEWISGFGGLAGLRSGLSGFDLIVVILKQISHTLLREILQATSANPDRVVYSSRRGISGVVQLLRQRLRH